MLIDAGRKQTAGIENTAHSYVTKFGNGMFVPNLFISIRFEEIKLFMKNVFGNGGGRFAVDKLREGGWVIVVGALGETT